MKRYASLIVCTAVVWLLRAMIPLSLLVGIILNPWAVLRPVEILRAAQSLWDDPL